MIKPDLLAKKAYEIGEQNLKRGVTPELLPEVKEFGGGYQAMVGFLLRRGAMLVGDMARPDIVVGHLEKERDEALEDINVREKLMLELGDCGFIALVIGGLLWHYLEPAKQKLTREIFVWTKETAHAHHVDLNNAVVRVSREKNVENYPEKDLRLVDGETVGQVVARLPGIYSELRARREAVTLQSVGIEVGYRHKNASMTDHVDAGGAYDF